ncbi:hypothetical protein [Neisseria iguanae]|uniref:Uncharacterized protein n=1 Tax=Neisseria iguanae TaxID=90242 RepID=A0A2P7U1V8_9NEIS|nr:hypothetical protein [Neisseria iguanae]PSJ80958.1 hypothetical protein C7N83_03075 [Neisseria iguanae]
MDRGGMAHNPVKLQDKFYLFKLSAVNRNPEAQLFGLMRNQLAQQAKQQKVHCQIDKIAQN